MDKKINELIKKASQYKQYKSDYFKLDKLNRDLEVENGILKQNLAAAEGSVKGMNAILKTTEQMLKLTKEQFSQ